MGNKFHKWVTRNDDEWGNPNPVRYSLPTEDTAPCHGRWLRVAAFKFFALGALTLLKITEDPQRTFVYLGDNYQYDIKNENLKHFEILLLIWR